MEKAKEMKIVDVIPFSKGIGKENLSYFTSLNTQIGSIVEIPLRNKKSLAIVVQNRDIIDLKSEIKESSFTIKRISALKANEFVSSEFLRSAEQAAEYFASSTGAVLNVLIPQKILSNLDKIKTKKWPEIKSLGDKYVMQTDDNERFANYKSLIREEFAKKRSVFFCLPTIEDIKRAKKELEKGIEMYSFALHSSLKEKEIVDIWNKIITEEHPALVIGTYQYLSIPRKDIKTIIIERESSSAYKNQSRPFVDVRVFAEILSNNLNSKIVFGDTLLRTETLWREKNGECVELTSLKFRSVSTAKQAIIDMASAKEIGRYSSGGKFKILSQELESVIAKNKEENGNMFVFGARKGLYPSAICGDCGHTVMCDQCSSPVIVKIKEGKENHFFCQKCGGERSALEKCAICKSWRLQPIGIGNDLIEKEIKKRFPDIKIFKIDKDSVKNQSKVAEIVNKFYSSPGSILIGTEMALLYLNDQIDNTAIVSIDSLFGIPDFSINEKIMQIILKIRSISRKRFILQTRNIEQEILDTAVQGNIMDFYRYEIENRKENKYPPFYTLVKITVTALKAKMQKEIETLESVFENFEYEIYPAFNPIIKGKYVINCLLKIPRDKWPDKEIAQKIRSLPLNFSVKVDPESIL